MVMASARVGGSKMKITERQIRRIIKEEMAKILAEAKVRSVVRSALIEQAPGMSKPKRILSTDPRSQKVYSVKYTDEAVGAYAGHDARGASDPEVRSSALATGVEIHPGSRGRGFDVIGNKHSIAEFDRAYRKATAPIRAAIESEFGPYEDRIKSASDERRSAGLSPSGVVADIGAQRRAYTAGAGNAGAQVVDQALSEEMMNKYDFRTHTFRSLPSLKFAKKIDNGPWPRR